FHSNFYQNKNQIDLDKIKKLRKDEEFEKIISKMTDRNEINTTFLKEAMELRKEKKDE
ncbi:TPA: hypothetical protein RZH73_001695, partial [Campylobacter coli]|nr:hypothetical protein [Campylobacter coli]